MRPAQPPPFFGGRRLRLRRRDSLLLLPACAMAVAARSLRRRSWERPHFCVPALATAPAQRPAGRARPDFVNVREGRQRTDVFQKDRNSAKKCKRGLVARVRAYGDLSPANCHKAGHLCHKARPPDLPLQPSATSTNWLVD